MVLGQSMYAYDVAAKNQTTSRAIERGYQYLRSQLMSDRLFKSCLGKPQKPSCEHNEELFSTLLIANLISNHPLAEELRSMILSGLIPHQDQGRFRFLKNQQSHLPFDVNSTSLGLSFLIEFGQLPYETVDRVVDQLLQNTNDRGLIRVYLSEDKLDEIVDPVVALNVLYLVNMFERGEAAAKTQKYVQDVLISRRYNQGTYFYRSADAFLFFFARLVNHFPYLKLQWGYELKRAVMERLGTRANAMERAMRLYMCKSLGIDAAYQAEQLLALQKPDGSWPSEVLLENEHGSALLAGSSLTSALALYSLEQA